MNLAQLFQQLLAIAKTDELKVILPALAAFFSSIASNPNGINVTAALAKLQVDVMAAQPGIAQDILQQVAAVVNQAAQGLLTPPAAKA